MAKPRTNVHHTGNSIHKALLAPFLIGYAYYAATVLLPTLFPEAMPRLHEVAILLQLFWKALVMFVFAVITFLMSLTSKKTRDEIRSAHI